MSSSTDPIFSARRRRRASLACISCRKSRVRCSVEPGQSSCTPCRQGFSECHFDTKDGRKNRINSRAITTELHERIRYLENLLKLRGQGASIAEPSSQQQGRHCRTIQEDPSARTETDSDSQATPFHEGESMDTNELNPVSSPIHADHTSSLAKSVFEKVMPHSVKFDMASGRVRFFGATTTMHILSGFSPKCSEPQKSAWPISSLVPDLSPDTHEYLIDLFFDCYNSVVHLVHKWAFLDDLKRGGTQFYSNFLHMTVLAEGYRYADKNRLDVKRLSWQGPESSIFHAKARKMAESELTRPGGIPFLQAFFLLGDLEAGIGRDDTGWLFAGIAFRLLFDIGLHVDPTGSTLSESEVQIRHMVLWASMINDVYWSLYLGRPTMLKRADIAPICLEKDFDRLIIAQSGRYPDEKAFEIHIYEALLQLMDLLGPLCETGVIRNSVQLKQNSLKITTLDRKLTAWYNDLPERLKWSEENLRSAPSPFYHLHTQYHTAQILLHRTFPINVPQQNGGEDGAFAQFSAHCRKICVSNAIQVAEIINTYRAHFSVKRCFATGLQHLGTAATAFMAEISILQTENDRLACRQILDYLNGIRSSIQDLSEVYQPAILMNTVVEHFIREFSGNQSGAEEEVSTTASLSTRLDYSGASISQQPTALLSATRSTLASHPELSERQSWDDTSATGSSYALDSTTSSFFPRQPHKAGSAPISPRNQSTALDNTGNLLNQQNLPLLPTSWLEEMNWEDDTQFLNLMGLKELQDAGYLTVRGENLGIGAFSGGESTGEDFEL